MHVKNEKMNMTQVRKCQFSRLIYKGCYFSDGVVSLPIGHPWKNFKKCRWKMKKWIWHK